MHDENLSLGKYNDYYSDCSLLYTYCGLPTYAVDGVAFVAVVSDTIVLDNKSTVLYFDLTSTPHFPIARH